MKDVLHRYCSILILQQFWDNLHNTCSIYLRRFTSEWLKNNNKQNKFKSTSWQDFETSILKAEKSRYFVYHISWLWNMIIEIYLWEMSLC